MRRFVTTALACLSKLAACEALPSTPPNTSIAQGWVCGREYVNHAWGYARHGIIIDRNGEVWRYNIRSAPNNLVNPWQPRDLANMSEDELKLRYLGATKTGQHVAVGDLARQLPAIDEAANGKLTEPRVTAADMGAYATYCLAYDARRHSYRQVLLEQHGDITITNTSAAAQALATWLTSVLGKDD